MWREAVVSLMGTFVAVALWDERQETASALGTMCVEEMERVTKVISAWDETSPLSALNREGRLPLLAAPQDLLSLIAKAERMRQKTHSLFEPFSRELVLLWRDARKKGRLPERDAIERLLHAIPHARTDIQDGFLVTTPLELDGIGKGYVIDRGIDLLRGRGVSYARINGGGDIAFLGDTEWEVEIEAPWTERLGEAILGRVLVKGSCAVASSGSYRSNWELDGKRYHHILDPRTGYPGEGVPHATVVAPDCATADAVATAITLLEAKEGIALLSELKLEGLVVDDAGRVYTTPSLHFI